MTRVLAPVLAVTVVLASVGTGLTVWLLTRNRPPQRPEISAYSRGHLTRVGPYFYCDVLDLNSCDTSRAQGELPVNAADRVQLSLPTAISRAPWRLLTVYSDPDAPVPTVYQPGSRLAVTIPTVDPQRGRLSGVVVQLLTLARDPAGELFDVPHAEWSVRTVWS